MLGVGGGDTAADQEAAPGLVGSDDEENKGLSDNDEDDLEEAEEVESRRLETLFPSAVKPEAKAKAAAPAKAKVQPQQNTRPEASGTPNRPHKWILTERRAAAEASRPKLRPDRNSGQARLVERLKNVMLRRRGRV